MTAAEKIYLAVVLFAFVGFSLTLATTSAMYERHKSRHAAGK